MKKIVLSLAVLLSTSLSMFGQGANNIKINEVLTDNTANYLDEYGQHLPWIELVNHSFTTYNIRGMFITTDPAVLNKEMSVPERMKLMCQIPNGFDGTTLTGRHHLLLFLNSAPQKGPRHLSVPVAQGQPLWIALYDGNGKTLIDSVSVPALAADMSYARVADGADKWQVAATDKVTPESNNVTGTTLSKVEQIKQDDPYGIWLSLLSMAIVFSCLALLYVFMKLFGKFTTNVKRQQERSERYKTLKKIRKASQKAIIMAKDGYSTKGIEKEIYVAVIAMALSEYASDVHDLESGLITIKRKQTSWNDKALQMLNK